MDSASLFFHLEEFLHPAGTLRVLEAAQDTLGLRLQQQKVPVDVIVVDQVDRVPAEN